MSEGKHDLEDFFVTDDDVAVASYIGEFQGIGLHQDVVELLSFYCGDEELALDILEIQEIIKVPHITPVPRVPDAVLGIISLRGTIVPIIDLRRFMGLPPQETGRDSRVLVLRAHGEPVGLLVDRVVSVQRMERESIEPVPRTMKRDASEMLDGVGRIGERLLIVLELGPLLDYLEREV